MPLCVQTTRASRSAQLRLQNTRLEAARERQRLLRACTPSAQAARGCSLLVSTLCTIGAPRIYTCPYVNYTRDSYMEIKAQGLDFNEEKKKISNMVLIVSSGLVKKYFWYIKACTYSSNLGQAPHCKSGTRAEGPGSLAPSTCPLPGPSRRREGHGHWGSGRPQEGGAALKLLTRWCHLVLRLLVPVACW